MKHTLLDNVTHKDLRIITERSKKYGDNIASTLTFPTEFARVQSEYPIFFQKNSETQQFQSVVMFGFKQGENLFLDDSGWNASYIPIAIEREPFLIGFQNQQDDTGSADIPVIHINMDSPRVNYHEGEPVFLEHGGNSHYLQHIAQIMEALHDGLKANHSMFEVYLELDLIEPFQLDVQLNDGTNHTLSGYYTINQDKLAALDGEALFNLHRSGYLQCAYMVISSLFKIKTLVDKKNSRIANNYT